MEGRRRRPRCGGNFYDIFGKGNFYLEIQDQGLAQEHKSVPACFVGRRISACLW